MDTQNSLDWREWLGRARSDKKLGELAAGKKELGGNIALCAHQMVEHALKAAYICLKQNHVEKTHNLSRLAELVEGAGFAVSDKEKEFLDTLHNYFIPLRYPQNGAVLPTYEEAVQLFDDACKLLERIEKELG